MAQFSFDIQKTDSQTAARVGLIKTRRGTIQTPHFVSVATRGSLRGLDSQDLENLQLECALTNTYHLFLRPGLEVLKKAGGIQGFMNFDKPFFSDSGGFQAFSLGLGMNQMISKFGSTQKTTQKQVDQHAKLTEDGIHFKSVYDGTWHFFGPKESMHIQSVIGSEMIMAFDECTPPGVSYEYAKESLKRTHRWELESLKHKDPKQALYGIIQGGEHRDLREESTRFVLSQPFEGIAIGGSFGTEKVNDFQTVLSWITPLLDDRPRHLLGIGDVENIFDGVSMGVDTFDCVSPTRNARRGSLYVSPENGGSVKNKFHINIDGSKYKSDMGPIDSNCSCIVCQKYSRAYLRHLHRIKDLSYHKLATIHNVHFMQELMRTIRQSIHDGTFLELRKKWIGR
ncbi:MAG: tRNA guanosine(34) transglycosylase Tgt [Candidatus Woesearchaeota archaeon]